MVYLRLYEESKELINSGVDQFDYRDVEILSYQRRLIRQNLRNTKIFKFYLPRFDSIIVFACLFISLWREVRFDSCVAVFTGHGAQPTPTDRLMAVQIVSIESVESRRGHLAQNFLRALLRGAISCARRCLQKRKFPARLFAIPLKPMKARPLILP